MDNHGDFSALERARLLAGGAGPPDTGGGAGGSSGGVGSHPLSVGELASRAATPTTVSPHTYHSRYGLSAAPNFALMNSFLSGAHSADARKTILPELQHYWGAHTQGFPRYLMGGLYPSYPPLFSGPESLSLLGPGVACVSGGGAPAHSQSAHHAAQYQRLLEIQKEAYLASAAAHHSALYGMPHSHLPPYLDPGLPTSQTATGLSLVKQEPKDMSCTEKAARASERRKSDRELSGATSSGSRTEMHLKEPKLSPSSLSSPSSSSSSLLTVPSVSPSLSRRSIERRRVHSGGSSTSPGCSNGQGQRSSNATMSSSGNSNIGPRHSSEMSRSKCTSPSSRSITGGFSPSSPSVPNRHNSSNSPGRSSKNKTGPTDSSKKKSTSASFSKLDKASTVPTLLSPNPNSSRPGSSLSTPPLSVSDVSLHVDMFHNSLATSPNPSIWEVPSAIPVPSINSNHIGVESTIEGVPTQTRSPVPLATVQHDGMVLSALASPSSAAASSAPSKPSTIKQRTGGLHRNSTSAALHSSDRNVTVSSRSGVNELETEVETTLSSVSANAMPSLEVERSGDASAANDGNHLVIHRPPSRGRPSSTGSSEIVVDSTENEEDSSRSPLPKTWMVRETTPESNHPVTAAQGRAAPGILERTLSDSVDSENRRTVEDVNRNIPSIPSTPVMSVSITPQENNGVYTSTEATPSARTVCTIAHALSSPTATDSSPTSHDVSPRTTSSALPYYHTLFSAPQGSKKVHATTFVPEVGHLKGPSLRSMHPQTSPSSARSPALSSGRASPMSPCDNTTVSITLGDNTLTKSATSSPGLPRHVASSFSRPTTCRHPTRDHNPPVDSSSSPTKSYVKPISHESSSGRASDDRTRGQPGVSNPVLNLHSWEDNDSDSDERHELVIDDDRDSVDNSSSSSRSGSPIPDIKDTNKELPVSSKNSDKRTGEITHTQSLVVSESSNKRSNSDLEAKFSITKEDAYLNRSQPVPNSTPGTTDNPRSQEANKTHARSLLSSSSRSSAFESFPENSKTRNSKALPSRPISITRPEISNPTYRRAITSAAQSSGVSKRASHSLLSNTNAKNKPTERRKRQTIADSDTLTAARCGSAPPSTLSSATAASSSVVSPLYLEAGGNDVKTMDSSNHSTGNIPVGIAVAQIRPQLADPTTDSSPITDQNRDNSRVVVVSTSGSTGLPPPGATLTPSLVVAGPAVNATPWLPQMPFSLRQQSINVPGSTFEPSHHPFPAPTGYKFSQDSLTGQIFLIPSSDFVDHGTVWTGSATNFATAPNNIAPPTIAISGGINTDVIGKDQTPKETSIPIHELIQRGRTDQRTVATVLSSNPHGLLNTPATTTVAVNPIPPVVSGVPHMILRPAPVSVQSRGCSPIIFEDSTSTSDISPAKKPRLCSIGVQTCDSLLPILKKDPGLTKSLFHKEVQTKSLSELSTLNPLSVECPELDSSDSIDIKVKRSKYNPYTDPQILQAADGLELLSALAEKRPKSTSLDDPKPIFPSPSDSFKSDSASMVAIEDTLSPSETELKSGQCTPRREPRRDLSPKWTLSKKEGSFSDFKTPPVTVLDLETPESLEVRAKLAEFQRQYKVKQKELAKLDSKKSEGDYKPSKRGPGRPPKKKSPEKRSDDDSSSSSSRQKDKETQIKKKRPAEELVDIVDRVFRKLPPEKTNKVTSRSVLYVKSKTGPFFRRKSASKSAKRNKDRFGYDESTWPSFTEARHKKKRNRENGTKDDQDSSVSPKLRKSKKHSSQSSEHTDSEKRKKSSKINTVKTDSSPPVLTIKSEPLSTMSVQDSGLGILARFALQAGLPFTEPYMTTSSLTPTLSSSISSLPCGSLTTNFPTTTTTVSISLSSIGSSIAAGTMSGAYNSSRPSSSMSGTITTSSHHQLSTPAVTFGTSFLATTDSDHVSFSSTINNSSSMINNSGNTISNSNNISTSTKRNNTTGEVRRNILVCSSFDSATTSSAVTDTAKGSPSTKTTTVNKSSEQDMLSLYPAAAPLLVTKHADDDNSSGTSENNSTKRKQEDDSDTDTSDGSSNKKRKPGRPKKMTTSKTSGTETIWAKKSTNMGLMQMSESGTSRDSSDGRTALMVDTSSSMKPLFVDDEWSRRRSERIFFLSEPSPQASPSLSPRLVEDTWKLSNFIPKNIKKPSDAVKDKCDSLPLNIFISETKQSLDQPIPGTGKTKVTVSSMSEEHVKEISPCRNLIEVMNKSDTPFIKTEPIISGSSNTPSSSPPKAISGVTKSVPVKKKVEKLLTPKKTKMENKTNSKKLKSNKITVSKSGKSDSPLTVESSKKSKEKRAQENSKIKLQKAKSLHDITQRVKKKFNKPKKQVDEKSVKSKAKKKIDETKTSDSCSNIADNPPTPEPKSSVIVPSDLKDGLRVLYLNDGLFYEGAVRELQPPDIYGVLTAGQRGSRPHILTLEEILKDAVIDVKPPSVRYLNEGTRVCAFWSQQFSCLYPGTVAKSTSPNPHANNSVNVEFDDGDSGRIPINHIRLLPQDFPIIEYEPDPLENLKSEKKRRRTGSDAFEVKKSAEKDGKSGKKKRTDTDSEDDREEEEEEEKTEILTSEESGSEDIGDSWVWCGKSTHRPGMKGKGRKEFYKAISRGKVQLSVGDSAVFISTTKTSHPYIGKIVSLWESHNSKMKVKVSWFYHPEETKVCKKIADPKNALFESPHGDENDVQTIAYKTNVLSRPGYKRYVAKRGRLGKPIRNTFYVAGFYDPSVNIIKYEPGVL